MEKKAGRSQIVEHLMLEKQSKTPNDGTSHLLINYTDTKEKCRHLIKFTCKGTLRQMFTRVYRLEIQSVMLVFSTQLCELLPL
jgi:hypothetical protein